MTGPETGSGPDPTERMASVPRPPTAAELGATRAWWVKELGGTDAEAAAEAAEAAKAASPEPAAAASPEPTPPQRQRAELEAARAKLGRERTHAATSLRDKEGITQLEHTPITMEDAYSTTPTERFYWAEMRQGVLDGAQELKDTGATTEELQAYVREGIINELMQRMQAEVDAKTNPDTVKGKAKAKAVTWIREHPKTRIALGVGLSLGAVAATATGVGGVAVGMIAGRAALSGLGTYIGLKDLQEVGGNSLNHREGSHWWQFGKKGKLAALEQEQVDAMNADQRLQHMTQLLAAKARTGRNPEQTKSDDKALDMLVQKEREEIDARLDDKAETYRGRNLLNGAMKVLDQRVTEQLTAERKQLVDDKKVHRRRTFVAGTAATALAGYGAVAGLSADGLTLGHHAAGAVHHAVAHHGVHHAADAAHHHGAAPHSEHGGTEAPAATPDHAAHITESHPTSLDHYPEITTDQVDKGDTPYKVALKHLSRIQGWNHFSPAEQHEKAMHFASQLDRVGDHWRYTKEAIKGSFGFEHSTAAASHDVFGAGHETLPNYDQVAPPGSGVDHALPSSGAGEHVLPNGGVAAPDTHEFAVATHGETYPNSFANYPEIVTQPVRLGDSVTGVARDHLSHIQGWSHFSEAEQHLKTMHLANQLSKVGDHWRYTKEAIQASFNFKQ